MIIWGRIIGTILGLKVFGFFGAIIGFVLGSWFDQGLKGAMNRPPPNAPEIQSAFFNATFSVMGHLAKADGRVSVDEIRAAQNIMARLELNEAQKKEAIDLFAKGKNPGFDLDETLSNLYRVAQRYPDLLRFFVEIQLQAALADGELRPAEREMLLFICQKLHVPVQEFEQLWARQWASQTFHEWFASQFDPRARSYEYQQQERQQQGWQGQSWQGQGRSYSRPKGASLDDAYGVLGVTASASISDIKKAYESTSSR